MFLTGLLLCPLDPGLVSCTLGSALSSLSAMLTVSSLSHLQLPGQAAFGGHSGPLPLLAEAQVSSHLPLLLLPTVLPSGLFSCLSFSSGRVGLPGEVLAASPRFLSSPSLAIPGTAQTPQVNGVISCPAWSDLEISA